MGDSGKPGDSGKKPNDEGSSTTIDSNSPYYLHASDQPRQMQVNEILTDSNYCDWSQEMKNSLYAKNKMGFVNGMIKAPEDEATNEYMMWMRCDAMIKGWLTTAMEKNIRSSVKYARTAAEIWTDLEERFGKESAPRAYELKRTLTSTQQEGDSVSAYYSKIRGLWDEIQSVSPTPACTCGKCECNIGKRLNEAKDKERLYEFLMGLDSSFSTIRTQILGTKPTPVLSNAYHLVAEDEQQRVISATRRTTQEAAAFQVFTPSKQRLPETQRNKITTKEVKRNDNQEIEQCTHCGRSGHNREGCFKRIGYPEWWPGNKGKKDGVKPRASMAEAGGCPVPGLSNEQYQMLIKHLSIENSKVKDDACANMAGKNSRSWIVDTGATEHMTHDVTLLDNKVVFKHDEPVKIPTGDSIPVKGKGTCTLSNGMNVKNVLYIPDFECNCCQWDD